MTHLKAEPAGPVRSMAEFFALARAMELDAATRYDEIARQLRQQHETGLAVVFETLAETERRHSDEVNLWSEHRGTETAAELPWPIPDTFDAPPAEVAQSKLMTPYQALASAVRHEQRSFVFWTYVAAHAEQEDVKAAAERMALEELEHVSLLRRERRKAFHGARQQTSLVGDAHVTLSELAATERHLADLISRHPESTSWEWTGLAHAARAAAAKLDALSEIQQEPVLVQALPVRRKDDIAAICEYLVEAYLRLAESSKRQAVLDTAQQLGATAVQRLTAVAQPIASEDGP